MTSPGLNTNLSSSSFVGSSLRAKDSQIVNKVETVTATALADKKITLKEFVEIARTAGVKESELSDLLNDKNVNKAFDGKTKLDKEATLVAVPELSKVLDKIISRENFLEKNEDNVSSELSNPMKVKIKDEPSTTEFKGRNFENTNTELRTQILSKFNAVDDKDLNNSLNNLINKIGEDKEALGYLNLMADRVPAITDAQMKGIAEKLSTMWDTKVSDGNDSGTEEVYDLRIKNTRNLVVSAMHDIALPSNISQQKSGTCGGASIQVMLAIKNPEKYLDILDSLAKDKNYNVSDDSSTKEIKPNWSFTFDKTSRSISSKIMQNAIMDFSNGNKEFDSTKDDKINGGMNRSDTNIAHYYILNSSPISKQVGYEQNAGHPTTREEVVDMALKSNPSRENPIFVGMNYKGEQSVRDKIKVDGEDETIIPADTSDDNSGHAVVMIGIDDKNVTIINPWGREETMSREKFDKNVTDVFYDPNN